MDWSVVGSGLAGSLIGAGVALISVIISHTLNAKKDEEDREKELFNYKQALHDELDVFWKAYKEGIGDKLSAAEDNYALTDFYPEISTPFVIYEGNVDMLGRIKDHELRKLIVNVYSSIKTLLGQLSLHNELLVKHENAYWEKEGTTDPSLEKRFQNIDQSISASTRLLVSRNKEIKEALDALLREFNKHGVLSN
ncbi:hypothetical protein [Halomonas heilongjiangensis]|uniref:hypothetical protein n=1 Tax=Halomonas heilongjiangensis TaxID=1387883 RepID=UPI0011AF81BB|nr:hypothetical protein [Halomonas heilongjiangensis]